MAQAFSVHRSLSRQTRSPCFHAFIKAHSGKFRGRCARWHLAKFTLPVGKKLLQQDCFPVCVFSLWSSEKWEGGPHCASRFKLDGVEAPAKSSDSYGCCQSWAKIWVDGRIEELTWPKCSAFSTRMKIQLRWSKGVCNIFKTWWNTVNAVENWRM